MKRSGFRTGMVRDLLGLSYKRIEHYDRCALVQPDIQPARGRGSRRLFSHENLAEFSVLKKLLDRGLTLEKIRAALAVARKRFPRFRRPLNDLRFITDGNTLYVYEPDGGALIDLLDQSQPVLRAAVEGAGEVLDTTIGSVECGRVEVLRMDGRTFLVELVEEAGGEEFVARCPEFYGISEKGHTPDTALHALRVRLKEALKHLQ